MRILSVPWASQVLSEKKKKYKESCRDSVILTTPNVGGVSSFKERNQC